MSVRDERGQTAVLLVGFVLVALLLVVVVVDASAAYLRRQGLDNVADGAALAAADGIAGRQVYEEGLGERARIDPELARALVAEHLGAVAAARRYPGLSWSVRVSGDRVVVHVAAPLRLPLGVPGVDAAPTITASAASYVAVSQ